MMINSTFNIKTLLFVEINFPGESGVQLDEVSRLRGSERIIRNSFDSNLSILREILEQHSWV
jgi:hypothetical protein